MSAEKQRTLEEKEVQNERLVIPKNRVKELASSTYGGGPLVEYKGRFYIGRPCDPNESRAFSQIAPYKVGSENAHQVVPNPDYKKPKLTHIQLIMEIQKETIDGLKNTPWLNVSEEKTGKVTQARAAVISVFLHRVPQIQKVLHSVLG